MTKFEVLRRISGIKQFSDIMFGMAKKAESPKELEEELSKELSERGLQIIKSVARSGDYPLSFDVDNKNSCHSLNKKEAGKLRKFDVLTSITGNREFSRLAFLIAKEAESAEMLEEELRKEVTGKKLQTILSVAKSGNYPLSLDGMQ